MHKNHYRWWNKVQYLVSRIEQSVNLTDIVQLSLMLKNVGGNDAQQNVSTDANANIVITHVVVDGVDVTVCDDFDKVRNFRDSYTQNYSELETPNARTQIWKSCHSGAAKLQICT